jgi:hypothetical protein
LNKRWPDAEATPDQHHWGVAKRVNAYVSGSSVSSSQAYATLSHPLFACETLARTAWEAVTNVVNRAPPLPLAQHAPALSDLLAGAG